MKLTNLDRKAFVASVMNDVPQFDYNEAIDKFVQDDMRSVACKEVLAILENSEIRHFLIDGSTTFRPSPCTTGDMCKGRYVAVTSIAVFPNYEPSDSCLQKIYSATDKVRESSEALALLEQKLTAAIGGCSTLAAAKAALPEFAKYLPTEAEKTANLPAIANLCTDLIAMGWPKNKEGSK